MVDEVEIYEQANRIIDPGACNPAAVARTLSEAAAVVTRKHGTEAACRHPALRAMAGQLAALFHVDSLGPPLEVIDEVKARVDAFEQLAREHELERMHHHYESLRDWAQAHGEDCHAARREEALAEVERHE